MAYKDIKEFIEMHLEADFELAGIIYRKFIKGHSRDSKVIIISSIRNYLVVNPWRATRAELLFASDLETRCEDYLDRYGRKIK